MKNKEAAAMAVINRAHKNKGIYVGSRKDKHNNIWLQLKFDSHLGLNLFDRHIHREQIGKLFKLGNKPRLCEVMI